MTSKKQAKYRGSLLINTAISAAAALIAEVVMLLNSSLIDALLENIGYRESVTSLANERSTVLIFVYVLIGIVVFALVFGLLQHKTLRYTRKISSGLMRISEGDFDIRIPVEGDNELSDIAMQVNNMAQELCLLMDREKKAEQTKNDLITNIAHDLRTPLTSIIGYLDIITQRPELDEATRQAYVKIAHDKAKHLQRMIEDLFGFTRINYTNQARDIKPVDIVLLLGQLLEEFYPVFEKNQMNYEYHPNVNNYIIEGDSTLLVRLFDNLINNGIKYGKEGKLMVVNARAAADSIVIEVINYGKVISKQDLARIFEKFYRGDASRNSQTGGTGLGLAIAMNIVKLHGGTIDAQSSIDGTIFRVELPRKQPQKEESAVEDEEDQQENK